MYTHTCMLPPCLLLVLKITEECCKQVVAHGYVCPSFIARAPVLPEISPSTFSGDLTGLLEESCLPGGTADLEIEVSPQYLGCRPCF